MNIVPNGRYYFKGHKKGVSDLCRTATTIYPCCIPTLGDLMGAGRTGLTPVAKVETFFGGANHREHKIRRIYSTLLNALQTDINSRFTLRE